VDRFVLKVCGAPSIEFESKDRIASARIGGNINPVPYEKGNNDHDDLHDLHAPETNAKVGGR
jgi:hypothetical protein